MDIDKSKYLILLSHCVFINGYCRSIISDLQRSSFNTIPKNLSRLVKLHKGRKLDSIYSVYENHNKKILGGYFEYLINNEYVFLSEHKNDSKRFTSISSEFTNYNNLDNIVIEFNVYKELLYNIENIENIEIRYTCNIDMDQLLQLLCSLENKEIRCLNIIIPYNKSISSINFENLFIKYQFLGNITLYNSELDKTEEYLHGLSTVKYVTFTYTNVHLCGSCDPSFFTPNQPHYIESQKHNTCLNRKICIDADGEIRNCPAMKKSYGNIKDTTLKEAMEKPGFKDLWFICKDQIDVCKDCEFRHMCTDCRAFIKDPDNIYSQPAKCTYNPYIAKWQGEEGYVPVEECGTYTKEKGFVVNKRKVNKLNKILWGE